MDVEDPLAQLYIKQFQPSERSDELTPFSSSCSDAALRGPLIAWAYERTRSGRQAHSLDKYPQRYMNDKVEQELVEFKREIERKYAMSKLNQEYRFPKSSKVFKPRQRQMEVRYSTVSDEAEEECSEEGMAFGESSSAGRMPTELRDEGGKQMTHDELDAWMGDLVVEEIDVLP